MQVLVLHQFPQFLKIDYVSAKRERYVFQDALKLDLDSFLVHGQGHLGQARQNQNERGARRVISKGLKIVITSSHLKKCGIAQNAQ
tara:strand:+ start:805 stop:1062 length:258 start_codon:yes stop_codon:yes gene_type:complete